MSSYFIIAFIDIYVEHRPFPIYDPIYGYCVPCLEVSVFERFYFNNLSFV